MWYERYSYGFTLAAIDKSKSIELYVTYLIQNCFFDDKQADGQHTQCESCGGNPGSFPLTLAGIPLNSSPGWESRFVGGTDVHPDLSVDRFQSLNSSTQQNL